MEAVFMVVAKEVEEEASATETASSSPTNTIPVKDPQQILKYYFSSHFSSFSGNS